MDYDIIPTLDLYDLLIRREEELSKLKDEYETYLRIVEQTRAIAVNRRNGKSQMSFRGWNESQAVSNWQEILN